MCVHKHYRITNNHKTEAFLYIRQRTFSVLDNVRPRSQTLDRNSYLYIKHYFSVQLSVFTLSNKEIKYTINVSYYYLQGGVSTTLRNGVLSGWICPDIHLHRPKCTRGKANVCVQIISTRLSVNSRIDEDTHKKVPSERWSERAN